MQSILQGVRVLVLLMIMLIGIIWCITSNSHLEPFFAVLVVVYEILQLKRP